MAYCALASLNDQAVSLGKPHAGLDSSFRLALLSRQLAVPATTIAGLAAKVEMIDRATCYGDLNWERYETEPLLADIRHLVGKCGRDFRP